MESAGCARRSFGTLGDFCGGGSGNLDLCDHSFVETKDNTVHAHKESVGTEEEKKNTLGNLIEWCARRFSGSEHAPTAASSVSLSRGAPLPNNDRQNGAIAADMHQGDELLSSTK
jgi:hypothetical protein